MSVPTRSLTRLILAWGLLAAAGLPATASADISAITEVNPQGTGLDLLKVNIATGVTSPLPAAVSSPDNELHPSLSPDGKKLVFQRRNIAGGTNRIVMVDLGTGASADLFNGFEATPEDPYTPAFSGDGREVITGREHAFSGAQPAKLTFTNVTAFPNGPYGKRVEDAPGPASTNNGRTMNPVAVGPDHFGYLSENTGGTRRPVLRTPTTTASFSSTGQLNHLTLSVPKGVAVYSQARVSDGAEEPAQLLFGTLPNFSIGSLTVLPPLVNTAADETKPAFSSDGRYLAFIRRDGSAQPRLFVWDSETQLLVNNNGVVLSAAAPSDSLSRLARSDGNIVLINQPVFTQTAVTIKSISFKLNFNSLVGIIVQRVVGTHKVLGRRAPKLKAVGRVPLGSFKKGAKRRAKWNLRVNGKRLRKGTYLVTPRAVTKNAQVRDLGRPKRIRIR